jgi:hypothetical protein
VADWKYNVALDVAAAALRGETAGCVVSHLGLCCCLLVFVLQIFVDMEELADLRLGFVLPWNYRWMIPGPSLLTWWGL